MQFAPQLLTLAAVVLLACVSPGPDFIAVTSNALVSRSRGLGVAAGVSIACAVWAALAMFGLGVLLTEISWLYEAIRLFGAAYLIYLGAKMLIGARKPYADIDIKAASGAEHASLRTGLMVGLTNPKSAAFFGSLFVTILPVGMTAVIEWTAVAIVLAIALAWFSLVAVMFSSGPVRSVYQALRRPIDAIMGAILISLGVRLATTR